MLRTIAGSGQPGLSGDGGAALSAKLNEPTSLAVNENALFIVEAQNYRVRKVDLHTGIISTYAGGTPGDAGDGGPATAAKFRQPSGVALDKAGNLFISDLQSHRIRRVSLDGKITTYASSAEGIKAEVVLPSGLVIDSNENLYVVSQVQSTVAKITPQGTATNISFFGSFVQKPDADWPKTFRNPTGVAVDRAGTVYVADTLNHRIVAALDFKQAVSVSAASYQGSTSSEESIVSVFGQALATTTEASTTLPLPTMLGGTRILVRDSAGIERAAPLFYVSPFQVNYLVPPGTSPGLATVTIQSAAQVISTGTLQIQSVSPALFAANQDGAGAASLAILRFKADGSRQYEPSLQWNATRTRLVPLPIDLSPAGDEVFLELYGTGIRAHQGNVRAFIGGEIVPVLYAGVAPGYVGLDQVNVSLPRSLIGRGEATLQLFVEGVATNPVTIHVGGTTCSAILSPLPSLLSSAGGTGSLNLSAASDCVWAAQSQDEWIQITSPARGAGNGVITFSVAPNASPNARLGMLRIAGQIVQVTQAGFVAPNAPVVTFTAPTTAASYETSVPFLTLRGTISTAAGVDYILWSNDRGARGVVNAATNWIISDYQLPAGRTIFTVTAYDQLGRVGNASLTVQHHPLYVYTVAGGGTKPVEDGAVATTVALTSANYAVDQDGTVLLGEAGKIYKLNADGTLATVLSNPELPPLDGMVSDRFSNVYVGSTRALTYRINLKTGALTEFGLTMKPYCTDEQGRVYLVGLTNLGGMRVVRLNPETRQQTTLAGGGTYYNPDNPKDYGDGKLATEVRLAFISGVVLDRAGNLYIGEAYSNRIRKVDAQTGIMTTFLGAAGSSVIEPTHPIALGNLGGLHFDAVLNRLYFLSGGLPTRIYQFDFTTGGLAAIAGSASGPVADEGRLATEILLDPATNFQTDKQGTLYLGEGNKNRIRKLSPAP